MPITVGHRTVYTVTLQPGLQRIGLSQACCGASRLLYLLVLVSEEEWKGYTSTASLDACTSKAKLGEVKYVTGVTDQGINFTSQSAGKWTCDIGYLHHGTYGSTNQPASFWRGRGPVTLQHAVTLHGRHCQQWAVVSYTAWSFAHKHKAKN